MITEPYTLGIYLGVPLHELDKIEKNHKDVDRQMIEVIKYWQNNTPGPGDCSWKALANAVDKMDKYGNLVKQLRDRHSTHVQMENVDSSEVEVVKSVNETAAKAR